MSQKYDKLKNLLRELFQLDQPDLDFGLYRIMHAKADEITQFLDTDLLPQVREAFGEYRSADKAELEKEIGQAEKQAKDLGFDPDQSPQVRELREQYNASAVDIETLEAEVYDHLYSFFRRYYQEGDFLAKRVYKPGVYAIPYEGEEVKLHWANKDQYYIKTSEYLRDYTFKLNPDNAKNPMRVHFKLVDAAEGEHGNVKESNGGRVFVLADGDFMAEEDGEGGKELIIRFEYRPATMADWTEAAKQNATAAAKKKPPTQGDLIAMAAERILDPALHKTANTESWRVALAEPHVKRDGETADYSRLAAHIHRYTARNTFDYFIHKDLGGFLRRELDFYVKNEVMHLDDIENESAPRVEQYLSKIKVIRRIAGKIIDFLAQLEDFQKKLWLKKKFVTECSWCIRVGCIPEEFYAEIAANDAQWDEWEELHSLSESASAASDDDDLFAQTENPKLKTGEFLAANPTLIVDTRHFDELFVQRLLETMDKIDEQTEGVLFHSENFQALSSMQAKCRDKVKCIYIDPPYNTGSDGFAYRDRYQHSSWLSLMAERVRSAQNLMSASAGGSCNVNDIEDWRMRGLIESEFGQTAYVTTVITKCSTASSFRTVNLGPVDVTDRIIVFAKDREQYSFTSQPVEKSVDLQHFSRFITNRDSPPETWEFKSIRLQVLQKLGLECESTAEGMKLARERWGEAAAAVVEAACEAFAIENADSVFELKTLQKPSPWLREYIQASRKEKDRIFTVEREHGDPMYLRGGRQFYFLSKNVAYVGGEPRVTEPASTFWADIDTNNLRHEGDIAFPAGKKPIKLVERLLRMSESARGDYYLDFFAGSGTTGHAVINMNREDGKKRKFILVELEQYFDTSLLPRLKKVTFTPEPKGGKAKRLATEEEAARSPRMMKVVRLESYEDALNNLAPRREAGQQSLLDSPEAQGTDGLREQYILRYMLDVETRGNQSLLNVAAFTDPTAYTLKVKRPGSEESREVNVDLLETFNWLIGLTVEHMAAPQGFEADFERDQEKRLQLKGRLKQVEHASGVPWFRTVSGTTPDGRKTLVIWRNLPHTIAQGKDGAEYDNLVLDTWFVKQGYSSKDSEFDLIYVNGDNNLENLRQPDDTWKVRLIEEDFHRLMFDVEDV